MVIPEDALLTAGLALAHAAWSVSDLEDGELLCPLAMVQRSDGYQLIRYEADSQEEAIATGKAEMSRSDPEIKAWAFAREGLFRETSGPVDAISVDFWSLGMASAGTLVQRFAPCAKAGKFRLLGEPLLVLGGVAQEPAHAQAPLQLVQAGIRQHSEVAKLWDTWQ